MDFQADFILDFYQESFNLQSSIFNKNRKKPHLPHLTPSHPSVYAVSRK